MTIEFIIEKVSNTVQSHAHAYGQFILPYAGPVYISFYDQAMVIDENSVAYIPPHIPHKYRSDKREDVLLVNMSEMLIKEREKKVLQNKCHFILNDRLSLIADYIKTEAPHITSDDPLKYLFFYIYDKITAVNEYRSIQYIHDHYDEDIRVTTLAQIESYNPNYYINWFKKSVGMLPREYIQRFRIEKAKEYLLTTQYNLTQIASHVGYNHSSTMCKVFKTLTGITPKEYRQMHQ